MMTSKGWSTLVQRAVRPHQAPRPRLVRSTYFRISCKPNLNKEAFSTSTRTWLPSRDPGGKPIPSDGSYSTVYDDFNNILASDDPQLSIHSMGDSTFTLSDGLVSHTPLILLQNQVLLWDAPPLGRDPATGQETVVVPTGQGWEAWTDDVWRLFEVVQPRPEILIFGTGKTVLPPPPHIKTYLNSLGIQVEAHNTVSGPGCAHSMSDFEKRNACSTYNLLAEEERLVAAALLPNVRKPTQRIRSNEKAQESARPG